ncbi:hypothetical protein AO268_22495 [Pseudomonas sp. ICMP 8385]|uniref:hypothetical protein n=1 Tax=Pseudomonas sp. ICMP 8385 TaxID=1718920 RepID=UPI000C07679E|nr:hypothetical protein [Pseudomonas sp. ICMP 8385]PHN66484.1 hypothetical protein AO268_22495 [Pseudomonas sp. ICMP 8385]
MGTLTGRPRFQPSEEQRVAMRLVESLVNDGHLVLEPDRYVPNGGLRFRRPDPAPAPPAPPPMRTPNAAHVASLASVLIVLVFIAGVAVGAKVAGGW